MSALVELRTFRAVMDGPTFCWDLLMVQVVGDGDGLPSDLSSLAGAVDEAVDGEGALDVKRNRTDRIFVTATTAPGGDGEGENESAAGRAWLNDVPGWLRYVKLSAKPGGCELVWCIRVEGGPEIAKAIACAWQGWSRVTVTPGQQPLPMEAKKREPPLPPEIDDEGREHDEVIPLKPRRRTASTEKGA